jgi:hypothetical protein
MPDIGVVIPQQDLGSAPVSSNRHKVTLLVTLEAIAKFVPAMPKCSPGRGARRERLAGERNGGAGVRGGPRRDRAGRGACEVRGAGLAGVFQ